MQKIRYEVDPHNRLIFDISGRKSGLPKFRKVLDGRFRLDGDNNLSYHVKAPVSEGGKIPHQVKLKGEWSLTDDHNLCLTFDKWGRATFGDKVTLQGEILDAGKGNLLFAVTTASKDAARSTYVLNLSGSWKADKDNRLSFHVRKEKGRNDILTLKGAWQLDKRHGIVYQYEKASLVRKKRTTHILAFKGRWEIKDALNISYVISRKDGSAFDFEANAGIFAAGRIRYELGIRLSGRKAPVRRAITFFGKWNLRKDLSLNFEMERDGQGQHAMAIGLELSRRIFKGDGEVFLNLLKSRQEAAVYAGAAWRW